MLEQYESVSILTLQADNRHGAVAFHRQQRDHALARPADPERGEAALDCYRRPRRAGRRRSPASTCWPGGGRGGATRDRRGAVGRSGVLHQFRRWGRGARSGLAGTRGPARQYSGDGDSRGVRNARRPPSSRCTPRRSGFERHRIAEIDGDVAGVPVPAGRPGVGRWRGDVHGRGDHRTPRGSSSRSLRLLGTSRRILADAPGLGGRISRWRRRAALRAAR